MASLLSPPWLDQALAALADQAPVGSVSATINYVVNGTPDGKLVCHVAVAGGVVKELALGKAVDPDIVVSLSFDEAQAIVAGAKSAHSSFMTGGLKVEGDHATWLTDLQPLRQVVLATLQPLTDLPV